MADQSPISEKTEQSAVDILDGMMSHMKPELDIALSNNDPGTTASQHFGAAFSSVLECLRELVVSGADNEAAGDRFFDALDRFNQKYCLASCRSEAPIRCAARAGHQSLAILYNILVNEHPCGHRSNQTYVDGLFRATEASQNGEVQRMPLMSIWTWVQPRRSVQIPANSNVAACSSVSWHRGIRREEAISKPGLYGRSTT